MLFLLFLIIGLTVLLTATIFLGAVVYPLLQYQLPNRNYKKPVAIIIIISIIFIFIGFWLFSSVPWETI